MKALAKVIGRLLSVLVNNHVILHEQAEWILEPAKSILEESEVG